MSETAAEAPSPQEVKSADVNVITVQRKPHNMGSKMISAPIRTKDLPKALQPTKVSKSMKKEEHDKLKEEARKKLGEQLRQPEESKDNSLNLGNNPYVAVFIGKPRSGKTFCMRGIVYNSTLVDKHWKFGRCYSTSGQYNEDWKDYLPKHAIKPWDPDEFQNYIESLRLYREKHGNIPPNFIIFDDLLGMKDFLNNSFVLNFFSCHRHTGTTVLLSAQYTGKGTNTVLREITNYAFMWKSLTVRSREYLADNFGVLCSDKDKFLKLLDKATMSKDYGCLFYNANKDSAKEAYSKFICDGKIPKFKLEFNVGKDPAPRKPQTVGGSLTSVHEPRDYYLNK